MTQRVVVTGMAGVTAFGNNWADVSGRLKQGKNAVRYMAQWEEYQGLNTLLGAPIDDFVLPEHYTRKRIRSMGRVSLLATRATELALEQAGLLGEAVLTNARPASPTAPLPAAPNRSASSPPC
ncbi:3-oxoacyl-(acyl carrier protein) synthase II [Serratia plymuthica]|uniref:3-oxoacyl-(Acyl carrier protein) synthase II n=1 Tax=Serratia plymuthica TaxID=82996 RepID=A0A2X4TXS3_SERPL|nr:3-oxoacyl-(acyl carrier protein) synthase II [Serratia plymuthica]